MGKMKDIAIKNQECDWDESKHHGKSCPVHGYAESDLTDEEKEDIQKAGGLDADKPRIDSEKEAKNRVHRTETIWKNRIDDIISNPESYFKKSQLQRIHNYAVRSEISEKKFMERVATKMVMSRFSPEQAIEWVYKEV